MRNSKKKLKNAKSKPALNKKELKYEDLVSQQSADGSWSADHLGVILEYIPSQSHADVN